MNKFNNYKKRLPRLEILLPLVYISIAATILLYQKLIPDYTPGYDVMTGAINVGFSDIILSYLTIPAIPLAVIIGFFINIQELEYGGKLSEIMIWQSFNHGHISIIWTFIITPFSYWLLISLIKKFF